MSLITKITTYNVPYEIASADRFYKDIDNKLANYKVLDEPKFSYAATTTTTMTITVTDEGKRASYLRIESKIFGNTPVSYWFLTATSRQESSRATQYSATLDAVATFGEQVFDKLDGQKLKIDRLHEDRYIFDGTNFNMNTKHHALINSDFKLGDTKGVELVFDGGKDKDSSKNSTGIAKWVVDAETIVSPNVYRKGIPKPKSQVSVDINNKIVVDGKTYYVYAFIQFLGAPVINTEFIVEKLYEDLNNNNNKTKEKDVFFSENSTLRETAIAPVSLEDKFVTQNRLEWLKLLQEGKVVNLVKLPYKLKETEYFQLLFNKKGERLSVGSSNNNGGILDIVIDQDFNEKTSEIKIASSESKEDLYYEIFCFKNIRSVDKLNKIEVDTSKLSSNDIMDFIARTKTPTEMKRIVDADESERLEIGLLNTDIMPINYKVHDLDKEIDIPNFYNQADITKVSGSYTINELGLESVLELSPNQYIEWSENTIMSFATDQGATYLARNKYTQDAQRKGIDIQKDISVVQARSREAQAGAGAANPLSAIMSLGASLAGGAAAAAYAGQEANLQKKLASNKKDQIQSSINDASATTPSLHTGSVHNLSGLNTQEYKYNFNWVMKKPNKFLRDKMVNFYDRHGYTFHDWIKFSKDMVENRKKFNYIEMDEFMDFIGTFADFDINVLNLLDAEFKKGLRLWHEDIISYNDPNIEIVIEKEINQIK